MVKKKEKGKKNKKLVVLIIVLAVVAVAGIYIYSTLKPVKYRKHIPVVLTKDTLPAYLESNQVIQGLPRKSDIQINFGDTEYAITKGSVEREGSEDPDIIISAPEEYIGLIGEEGLCAAVQGGIESNKIQVETELSEFELLMRYGGMLKFRDCVGLQ